MSLKEYKAELQEFVNQQRTKKLTAVVMPDFFLDRLLDLSWTANEFSSLTNEVVNRKGGSIDGISQADIKGGNAVNTASALAALGIKVTPILCTSEYGLHLLKYHLKAKDIDLSHVKIFPKASVTTALELQSGSEKVNVMLRDVGSLADLSPEDFNVEDFEVIDKADYVCLFNWAGTKKYGTELAKKIFEKTKQDSKGKTYYDTADPTPNLEGIDDLIKHVFESGCVDVLSLNENEAVAYAAHLDDSLNAKRGKVSFADLALEAARVLSKRFSARIDLHTTAFSASLKNTSEVVVPTFEVNVVRATGAGDAWNAGNVFGDGNGFSDGCRLMVANAVSACYLSNAEGEHPSLSKILSFINENVQG
ncbi:MAG: carbohydrate kinase family protein [Candidatus Bathyarchaeia archaeon]|jgi:sugar/nucleoside kinase (ribokinase family)